MSCSLSSADLQPLRGKAGRRGRWAAMSPLPVAAHSCWLHPRMLTRPELDQTEICMWTKMITHTQKIVFPWICSNSGFYWTHLIIFFLVGGEGGQLEITWFRICSVTATGDSDVIWTPPAMGFGDQAPEWGWHSTGKSTDGLPDSGESRDTKVLVEVTSAQNTLHLNGLG